jgi:very-short-patch-repair endonuclease
MIWRCHPGVFRLAGSEVSFSQRCLAACLAAPGSTLTGRSAAVIHDLPLSVEPFSPEILLPHTSDFSGAGVNVYRSRNPPNATVWYSVRLASINATLISLAGLVNQPTLARCLDHAIAARLTTIPTLLEEALQRPKSRFKGRKTILDELDLRADGRVIHRSKLEQQVSGWMRRLNVDGAHPNFLAKTATGHIEIDFAWPELRVGLEISPFFTHGSKNKQARDAERRKELAVAGWRLIEATDNDLSDFATFAKFCESLRCLLA